MVNKEYKDILDIVESGQEAEEFCPLCLVKNKFRSKLENLQKKEVKKYNLITDDESEQNNDNK